LTYLVESLLQTDTLRGDSFLRDTSGCHSGCIEGDSGVDDGTGWL